MAPDVKALAKRLETVPFYPVALVGAFVVAMFVVWWPPASQLVRPLVVVGGATLALQLVVSRIAGRHAGAYVAALAVTGLFELRLFAFLVLLGVVPLAWQYVKRVGFKGFDWPRLTRFVNLISLVALVFSVGSALAFTVGLPANDTGRPTPETAVEAPADAPDIYLVLLDGYPRADTLQAALGMDNTPFLERMEAMGFDLAERSHSNYNRTALTVTSMLNAKLIDDLMPNPPGGYVPQNRWLSSFIKRAEAVQAARRLGYDFVDIPMDVGFLTPTNSGTVLDKGHITHFEYALPQNGAIRSFLQGPTESYLRDEARGRILDDFEELQLLPHDDSSRPRLVFAHLNLPHHPYIFRADGSYATVAGCYWEDCDIAEPLEDDMKAAIREQFEYTNGRVEELAQRIIAESARPVAIVFFGDHGFRHWLSNEPETYHNLLLAYTEGREGVFPENASTVNIIPRLLNAYLDADLPLANDDVWLAIGGTTGYFPLVPPKTDPRP